MDLILLRNLFLLVILIVITYTDFKRREIDNEPLILGATFAIMFTLAGYNNIDMRSAVIGFFLAGTVFYILAFWGMGGGDVKLIAVIGLFLGYKNIVLVMYASFVIGLLFAAGYMLFKKTKLKETIPFGPAIAIATTAVMFWGPKLMETFGLWYLQ